MVLLTGPTGAAKSTTLHTPSRRSSRRARTSYRRGPGETASRGSSSQVKNEIGSTFRSLRSILRQDPDIIMVGEIRDAETAQIAVRAAPRAPRPVELHTNDAVSTLVRLINLGVEPFLVASA